MRKKVAVIGAGVSGIAAAYHLRKRGHEVVMFERLPTIGGRIATAPLGNRKVAIGGKNVSVDAHLFRQFVHDNGGAQFEDHGINIVRELDGRLVPLKGRSLVDAWRTVKAVGMRDLVQFSKYFKLVSRAKGQNDFLGNDDFIRLAEESDHRSLASYFGRKFNDKFLRLLTVRMNGAEPDECFLGNLCVNLAAGSVRGMEQLMYDGLDATLRAFEQSSDIRIVKNTLVKSVIRAHRKYTVRLDGDASDASAEFDGVIVAVPAIAAGSILTEVLPGSDKAFGRIAYNSTAMAVVQYREPIFSATFKAISFGPEELLFNAGAYGVNDLDIVRYTFSGKAAMQSIDGSSDPEALVEHAENVLSKYCKQVKGARQTYAYRYFTHGHCSYAPYHHRVIKEIRDHLAGSAIEVTGDYIKGTTIEACFVASISAVDKLCDSMLAN